MTAWSNLADGIHRLAVFIGRNPKSHLLQSAEVIGIHNKFFEGRHKPTFEPPTGVQHEVHPTQKRRVECVGCFISGLCIGQFRAAKPATGAKWEIHPAGQLPGSVKNLAGLGRAEGRRA